MSATMTMSQDALTMYILHPMFWRPMGMMNTKTSLFNSQHHARVR